MGQPCPRFGSLRDRMKRSLMPAMMICAGCASDAPDAVSSATAVATSPGNVFAAPAARTDGIPATALAFLRAQLGEDLQAEYAAARIDLNADGREELIAYLIGPRICGSGGCDLYVLTPDGDAWRPVMAASVSRLPVRLLPTRSNGWQDLSVAVAGGGLEPSQARMRFDGDAYPDNPTAPPAEEMEAAEGTILIAEDAATQPLP